MIFIDGAVNACCGYTQIMATLDNDRKHTAKITQEFLVTLDLGATEPTETLQMVC